MIQICARRRGNTAIIRGSFSNRKAGQGEVHSVALFEVFDVWADFFDNAREINSQDFGWLSEEAVFDYFV
jgi:hypothetical protein